MTHRIPLSARLCHAAMAAYGVLTPDHPGKGNVIAALATRAKPSWREPITVSRRYGKYHLDLNDMVAREIFCDTYEPCESRIVSKMVQPGWTCLDAGANIGYFSILLSRLVGPSGKVYSFEPSPVNLERLQTNLRLSEAVNVVVTPVALSDREGQASFSTNQLGNLGGSMIDEGGTETVELVTIDRFVRENALPRLDFIKIDIEGSEVACLRGAEKTLRKYRPSILVEINPKALLKHHTSAADLHALFNQLGYRMKKVTWAGLKEEWSDPPLGGYCNVVATPTSTHQR